ncbi:NnrS family protein [Psychrosphaera sp. 1_MG-2023]|uniref:NnrS family protein n=1 Tax=Psychrosphaera sp. 1_MG-2023 TaxID=3062643 RepID=UPI0026E1E829|nr:NnrS family protein [Psychrosphaera sp. 1_MG-2023]MDO6721483.1 NnrS family protein [Psychrosphaera sp. 1_MG-2023]
MNISDLSVEQNIPAIWRQAFRPLFLIGTLFAIVSMALWALFLNGNISLSPYGGPLFWHAHEMLFGFVAAIIVGFLLTAVQNWTGLRATHGKPLAALVTLWLAGRILILTNISPFPWLTALVDISFLVVSAVFMGQLVFKVKQYRNMIFLPVLLLLVIGNSLTHLSVLNQNPAFYIWGAHSTVMTITLIITIIAGRVLPMFTANGTQTEKVPNLANLETAVIGSTLFLALLYLTNLSSTLPNMVTALVFVFAACSHAIRAMRWRPQVTLGTPLVWSLHLSYWFIPVSFGLFALHKAGVNITASTALHGLTAGAISSIILAMVARISLGHTGRTLTPQWVMKYAFMLIIFAAVSRICAQHLQANISINIYLIAAGCWILAYLCYVIFYWKILTSPRPDGRPG